MTLNILIAPSGFKECLDASDVARAIAEGVKMAMPQARTMLAPLVDGGEALPGRSALSPAASCTSAS
jgi:glycerate kinase